MKVFLMDRVDSDKKINLDVKVWKEYDQILKKTQDKPIEMKYVERFEFYEQAKKSYAVILTGYFLFRRFILDLTKKLFYFIQHKKGCGSVWEYNFKERLRA